MKKTILINTVLVLALFAVNGVSFLYFRNYIIAHDYSKQSAGIGFVGWCVVLALSILALCECRKRIKLE